MKTLLLIFSLVISSSLGNKQIRLSNKEIIKYNKYIAENSTTAVTHQSQSKQSYGTGLFVKIKNKTYVLTNAHICLPENLNDSIVFGFNSKNESLFNTYSVNELVYNKTSDVCFIPLKEHLRSKYSYDFKTITQNFYEKFQNNGYQELFKHFGYFFVQTQALIAPQLYTLTFNHKRQYSSVESYVGSFLNWNFSHPIQMASSNGSTSVINHPRSQTYSFPTHQGDSGSPVFNANYELVGIIFANTIVLHNKKDPEYTAGLIILSEELIKLSQRI